MRSPTGKFTSRRSASVSKAPETRRASLSSPGLDHAGRAHQVLALQGRDERLPVDAEIGQFPHRELDEDALVLGADDLDLRHVRNEQQTRADRFDVVAQLAAGEAVGGEAIDDAEGVAEAIVEERTDRPGGQGVAHIRDEVADPIPGVLHLRPGTDCFEVDEDRRNARSREAADEVEPGGLLELPLEPLGHLLQRFFHGRARPGRGDDHRLDDEGGILVSAKTEEGEHPGGDGDDHQVATTERFLSAHSERLTVIAAPFRARRTVWPSRSRFAPAVTTMSPGRETCGDEGRRGVDADHVELAQRHGAACRIDEPDSGPIVALHQGARGNRQRGKLLARNAPGDGRAEPHGGRRIGEPDPDAKGAGDRVGLRRDLAHAALRRDVRIRRQGDDDTRAGRRRAQEVGRHLEDGLASFAPDKLDDHPAGRDDFAGFGSDCRDEARRIGPEHGEADDGFGGVHMRLGGLDLSSRRNPRLLGILEIGARRHSALEEMALPLVVIFGLAQNALRLRQRRLRAAQFVELVLRVEARQHLPVLHRRPDSDKSLGKPAADAEGERGAVLRFDMSGEGDVRRGGRSLDRDGPDRPHGRRRGVRTAAARCAGEHRCNGCRGTCEPDDCDRVDHPAATGRGRSTFGNHARTRCFPLRSGRHGRLSGRS